MPRARRCAMNAVVMVVLPTPLDTPAITILGSVNCMLPHLSLVLRVGGDDRLVCEQWVANENTRDGQFSSCSIYSGDARRQTKRSRASLQPARPLRASV